MASTGVLKQEQRADVPSIVKSGKLNINAKNNNYALAA
jgi:hypothetical protein